ncbi:Crp/Fnr family transcriptional regulator [Massilia sp. MB5]|uniref:Crp/Fnr family transcriptional regulator n=1 Tax=Massilia sp. MB5 TaxID=2919578 RepID=UPI001F0CF3BD|nr:Crp/Fnr family transcriptional regulator [Massilia sp. MB5]UMR28585.1 Crp/Fnr family transcriptional regulator [Massilia sp. MB5]
MIVNFDTAHGSALIPSRGSNRLLASLPEDDLDHIQSLCELAMVDVGEVLFEPGQPITHLYFPLDALVCLLAVAEGRMTLEVGAVGREGMLGASVALGHQTAQARAVVQRAGYVLRMESGDFCREFAHMESLQRLLSRYTDALLAQAIQIAVCSRFHVLEARLARTLLVTRDRLQSERFHLTHEFLAHALGVRRVGVTKAASALQQQGLISYSRGNIEILDSAGLEAASCGCYELVKDDGSIGMGSVFL